MPTDSPQYLKNEANLPPELRDVYWRMVEHYEFYARARHGRRRVDYEVLAQMVLAGWRLGAEAYKGSA